MSSTNRGRRRASLDRYYTQPELAERLCGLLPLRPAETLLEPHCGAGAFCAAALNAGLRVSALDLDPHAPGLAMPGLAWGACADFLDFGPNMLRWDWIIGNPPYSDAERHIRHALNLGNNVAFLLRLAFLESAARFPFWAEHPARRVYVLAERPAFADADNPQRAPGTDSAAYAWFIWERGYTGRPELEVFSWKNSAISPRNAGQGPNRTR